jgi:hypothetical protein
MWLRPGRPVLQYDDDHVQVGLEPPLCLVLPDTDTVREALGALQEGVDALPPEQRWVAEALHRADLLVSRLDEPALAAAFGDDAADIRVRRSAATVGVQGPAELRWELGSLLAGAGITMVLGSADLTVQVDTRPARRHALDAFARTGASYLVVSGAPTHWTVGPLVVPGEAACQRCVDAHLALEHPGMAQLSDQAAQLPRAPQPDQVLQTLALALAAQQVVGFVDGARPEAWSATIRLRPHDAAQTRVWTPHPHCGCTWDRLARAQA